MKTWLPLLLPLLLCASRAGDVVSLVADRAAIERIYHEHRLGEKPPFEQVSPPSLIERLVRKDLRKEALLGKFYGVEITPAMLDAEVGRIDASTRAPGMLGEIKAALGGDPERFADSFAKRFLVDRLLREKFESDAALHASQRRAGEAVRKELLAARADGATAAELLAELETAHPDAVTATTWQLGARPAEGGAPGPDERAIADRFGPEARLLATPTPEGGGEKFYFADLPAALRRVLDVQLREAGDLSAVIEAPGGFLMYVCLERSDETLSVAGLSLRKQSFEQWLSEQSGEMP